MSIKLNSIVAYRDPNPDECFKSGDPIVFKVIEDNENRVVMEVFWTDLEIKPVYVAQKNELRLAFKQHTDVPVPEFIDLEVWQDNSWYNDETASVIKDLEDGFKLRFWIYSDEFIAYMNDPNDDPIYHYSKYVMCIEDEEGHMTQGRQCLTDEEAIKAIEEFKTNWRTLKDTEEWS